MTGMAMTGRVAAAAFVMCASVPGDAQQPAAPDGWVVLSVDDYRALRARAFPTPPDPVPPPVDATLTRVDYDVRVTGDTVAGEARLTVDVLKQGWVSVRIPAGVLVRAARLDGRPTALVDDNPPRVLIAKPGRASLTLDVVIPVAAAAGSESITLPPSGSAVSTVTLAVPRDSVDLAVTGGFVGDQTAAPSETRWVVHGTASKPLTMSWKRKADDRRATLPLRTRARITELVVLGEDSSVLTIGAGIEVVQGIAREVVLSTPDGIVVNQVSGATVADWRHDAGSLTVSFLEPVASETSFLVNAEMRAPRDGAIAIPIVRMPAAERETGGVAVDVAGAGQIGDRQPRGLEPADVSDIGELVAGRESPSMTAFRFRTQDGKAPRSLTVTVTRFSPQAVLIANVEEARYDALVGEDGKMLVRARYAVRNNQRSFLAVSLPAGSTLWSAFLNARPVRPGVSASGGLLLPLQKGRAGEEAPVFRVELVYLQRSEAWAKNGDTRIDLPAIDLPISRTGVSVRHSPRFSVDLKPGPFRIESDTGPWTATLTEAHTVVRTVTAVPAPPAESDAAAREMRQLLDRVKKDAGRTMAGLVPIDITFPELGPVLFVATELTPESRAPALDLEYHRR